MAPGFTHASDGSQSRAPRTGQRSTPSQGQVDTIWCEPGKPANLALIDLIVPMMFIAPGDTPDSYLADVFSACASVAVLPKLSRLFGLSFSLPGPDETGGDSTGPTAEFIVKEISGGTLDVTMTKQSDGHYEATAFTYRN